MAPKFKAKKVMKHGRARWLVDQRKIGRGRRYCESRAEADQVIKDLESEFENRHAQALNITALEAASFLAQKERLKKLGEHSIEEVFDFFFAHYRPVEAKTVAEAVEACLKAKESGGRRARSVGALRSSLKSFEGAYSARPVASITRADIEAWLANPAWKSLATRKGKRTDIRTFFAYVQRAGWRTDSPAANLERIMTEDSPPEILTVEQCKTLMEAVQAHAAVMIPYFALSLFCGIRCSEMLGLTWADVRVDRGFIEITPENSKTRQRRLVTISENCKAWLKLGGEMPPVSWRKEFDYARKKAGLYECWPSDAMRHSFVSYHYAQHGAAETAKQAGHSEQILFKHYREIVTPEQAKEFWAILPREGVTPIPRPHDAPDYISQRARAGGFKRWEKARGKSQPPD